MAKIMLVEDDNNLRQIYEDRLAAEGYEIVSAPDGEEALALAVKERPDLIIADVMMPKVSGFDMLDILRSTPETKDCKIIMMTALSQAEDKARAEKLGADRYLVKSQVTLEDVAKIAGEILNGESAVPAAPATPAQTAATVTPTPAPATVTPTPAPTTTSIPVSAPPAPADPAAAVPITPAEPTTAPPTPAAAPEPASVPTPAPAVTNIPITTPSDDDQPAASDKKVEAAAEEASRLATPAAEEKAQAEKVDEFIASNPTLSDSAEPVKPAEVTPAAEPAATPVPPPEPAPAPEALATPPNVQITVEEPAPAETPAPSEASTTTPASATNDPSQKVADAVDGLLKETENTPTPSPEETPKNNYVADSSGGESQSMTHTKRIEPISDGSIPQPPDINELLAREGEVTTAQPPVSSVISPGTGGSVNAAPVDNTPQINTLADNNDEAPATPTSGPTVTPAPNSDITL